MIKNMRLSKVEIIERFRAYCQKFGKAPGEMRFLKVVGLKRGDISYYWPRFSDLVKEGGAIPQTWQAKIPESEIFQDYAKICLHLNKIPTYGELRITARELKTRTHTVYSERFGSIAEFDRRFKIWLEEQENDFREILGFSGWNRPLAGSKQSKALPQQPRFYFHPYLPVCLQNLAILAKGEIPSSEDPNLPIASLFERRCADAFRCLGLEVNPLGQGKGRAADCLATAPRERLALIIDAKVRREGYVLGTEDRKFLEYAVNHGRELQAKGFDKLYLVVIASSFRKNDLDQLTTCLANSPIRSISLVTADALMRIVEDSIRERHSFTLNGLDQIFFGHKVIDS